MVAPADVFLGGLSQRQRNANRIKMALRSWPMSAYVPTFTTPAALTKLANELSDLAAALKERGKHEKVMAGNR